MNFIEEKINFKQKLSFEKIYSEIRKEVEIKYNEIPYKVAINEAVELAKKYGEDKSNKFVTYILQNCQKIQLLMSNKMFFLKKEYDNLRESNYVYLIKNIKKLDEMKKDHYLYRKARAKAKAEAASRFWRRVSAKRENQKK